MSTESPLLKKANPPAEVITKAEFAAMVQDLPTSKKANVTVVTPKDAILTDAAKSLEKLRVVIVKHEDTFAAQTLGPRLQIGLQCLKAYEAFVHNPGKGGRPKKTVTRDGLPEGGFEGWLASQAQWLKKPTAYKYMTAVRGLALDHTASEKQVAAALKIRLRKGPVTIAALCLLALDPVAPTPPEPKKIEQAEFDFLRSSLSHFREETETLCRLGPQLEAYPEFKRAATARLYSALHELTGTHWTPSDEPDALASVDPDTITL